MKKIITTLIASAIALTSNGAWELIDDFQAFNDLDVFYDGTEIGWHSAAPDQTDEYWFFTDPVDPDNMTMYVESGNYGVGYGSTWVMKALPGGGIAPNTTGTIFFRCYWDGTDNNWHMATSDRPLAYDEITGLQTTPGAWGDLNAIMRLGTAAAIEHRDGGGYVATNPPLLVTEDVWYNIWMVIENTFDTSQSPAVSTGLWTIYMEGPGFGDGVSPYLVPVGTDPSKEKAFLRRAPVDPDGNPASIIWAVFATESGPPGNPNPGEVFFLDDFYFTQGADTSNPLDGPPPDDGWGGYPYANDAKDVNTGDWMGWINVTAKPYIYSYTLGWIYMAEPADDAVGAWGYVFK